MSSPVDAILRRPRIGPPLAIRVRRSANRRHRAHPVDRDRSRARMRAWPRRCHSPLTRSSLWSWIPVTASSARCRFVVSRVSASCISHYVSTITAAVAALACPSYRMRSLSAEPDRPNARTAKTGWRLLKTNVLRHRGHGRASPSAGCREPFMNTRSRRVPAEVESPVHRANRASRNTRRSPHARRVGATMALRGR